MSSSTALRYSCLTGREHPAGRDDRNIQFLLGKEGHHVRGNDLEIVVRPVHSEAQVATGQRSFDDDIVGQPSCARRLLEEKIQGARGRNDDAELNVVKSRVVLDE